MLGISTRGGDRIRTYATTYTCASAYVASTISPHPQKFKELKSTRHTSQLTGQTMHG